MEEQQQAGKQRQRWHRGAAGDDGRRGARAAARGPHHGGRLTRSGALRAGQPGHPRRGAAAESAAVATPAVRRAEVGCEAETARATAGAEGTRPVAKAVLLSGARRRAGGGSRRGAAERWLREAARSRRGAAHHLPPGRRLPARRAWSALRGSLRRAPAGGRRQGARRASEPEGTVPSSGEEGRDQRSSAARSSRPREGSREGGGGSAHAARSFRRSNRGRPRERQAK